MYETLYSCIIIKSEVQGLSFNRFNGCLCCHSGQIGYGKSDNLSEDISNVEMKQRLDKRQMYNNMMCL